ncbi:unnamed protein product [Allacma fusca]|uniref:Uncharacterized protein n=1 Tax=Allacma fusca TaxID=39272 RepID=A0A8J2JU97_9HEXA|nr:unnamed protein product [Allacma fusca]
MVRIGLPTFLQRQHTVSISDPDEILSFREGTKVLGIGRGDNGRKKWASPPVLELKAWKCGRHREHLKLFTGCRSEVEERERSNTEGRRWQRLPSLRLANGRLRGPYASVPGSVAAPYSHPTSPTLASDRHAGLHGFTFGHHRPVSHGSTTVVIDHHHHHHPSDSLLTVDDDSLLVDDYISPDMNYRGEPCG